MSILTESPPKPSFSPRYRWLIGSNVLVSIGAAFALLVMANYLAAYHFKRFYFSASPAYRLSKVSEALLKSLTNEVNVTIFFDRAEEPVLYSAVSALLNEYAMASSRIRVEKLDYLRNPSAALLFKEKHRLHLNEDKNLILFESQGKIKTVFQKELSDYDISGVLEGKSKEVKRTAFRGEQLFTSAILSVTDAKQYKAYYLAGHNEHNPEDHANRPGYAKFAALLTQNNIAQEQLSLAGTNEVPADAQLLIIAGAQSEFLGSELEKVGKYAEQGGRLLVLLNYLDGENASLAQLLGPWGIQVGARPAIDEKSNESELILVITNFNSHPIVSPLYQSRLVLYPPRILERRQVSSTAADSPKVEELFFTSNGGRAVSFRNGVLYKSEHDRRGILPLALAVEKGSIRGVEANRGRTRIVAVGDSHFLNNQFIDLGSNRDFAVLAVNWLLDRTSLLAGILPQPVKEYRLVITQSQRSALRWILLGGLPGSILLFGSLVWWCRRH